MEVRLLRGHGVHHTTVGATFALYFFLGVVPVVVIIITIAWLLKTKGEDWYESEEVMGRYYKHQESILNGCPNQCITTAPTDVTEMTIPPVLLLETARRHPSIFDD